MLASLRNEELEVEESLMKIITVRMDRTRRLCKAFGKAEYYKRRCV